jgi:hypothetical protein
LASNWYDGDDSVEVVGVNCCCWEDNDDGSFVVSSVFFRITVDVA